MDFKYHLEKTWQTFTAFLPALLLITLALIGIVIVSLGILAPVCSAGYMQSLLRAIRDGRRPEINDLFSHMRLFLPLLSFVVLIVLALMIGFAMLVLPGIIAAIALTFFCLYMLPLMTDRNMGLIDAVKESSRMALKDPVLDHVVVVALYLGITAIGQSVIIGILFTQPFATLFVLSAFEERAGKQLPPPDAQKTEQTQTSPSEPETGEKDTPQES